MIKDSIKGVKGAMICKTTSSLKILGKQYKTSCDVKEAIKTRKTMTANTRNFLPW